MAEDRKSMDDMALEKAPWAQVEHLEPHMRAGLSREDAEFLHSWEADPKRQAHVFHKVDWRLCPMLAILYLISHLDRANIGNAKIEGLEASLGMSGTDYNVALAVFFVPYVLCEVPSNMLLAKFAKPSLYIGILIFLWGIVMTLSGVVQNFGGLVATRFFLGLFEYVLPKTSITTMAYFDAELASSPAQSTS